jgi:hypothetical protein
LPPAVEPKVAARAVGAVLSLCNRLQNFAVNLKPAIDVQGQLGGSDAEYGLWVLVSAAVKCS